VLRSAFYIVGQVENALYSEKDMDQFMSKLDGLVAANDPVSIARYVSDVAAVTNTPSVQNALSKEDRQAVCLLSLHTLLVPAVLVLTVL